ncbi:MAG TPA: hypothetical protein VF534_06620 [Paraburkholderia sp.]
MLLDEIRRLVARLVHSHANKIAEQTTAAAETPTAFELGSFDPFWHGDHWQNLLSSPMDARRYVIEDWSVSTASSWGEADGVAPAH